jgi:hypothetical protein
MKQTQNRPKPSNALRVLTLNLWQRYRDWAARRSVLNDGIRTINPDLVAFAESIKTDDYDQARELLDPEFNIAHSKARDPNGVGFDREPLALSRDARARPERDSPNGRVSLRDSSRGSRRAQPVPA